MLLNSWLLLAEIGSTGVEIGKTAFSGAVLIQFLTVETARLYLKGRAIPKQKAPSLMTDNTAQKLDFSATHFTQSAETLQQCPPDTADEVAFVGRSNAGKSSAINTLTSQPKLARTSKTPGRTQLLNFFAVADNKYLVDLPGFGFAKVPPKVKAKWEKHLESYLRERQSLRGLVLLMDCRHPLKDFDMQMITWCAQAAMPVHILLTKSDKLKSGARKKVLLETRRDLSEYGDLVSIQLFSALKGDGAGELKGRLQTWLCSPPDPEAPTGA